MSLPVPAQFPKRCSCCRATYSETQWKALPFVGVLADEWEALELRNSKCGSTISIITAIFQRDLQEAA